MIYPSTSPYSDKFPSNFPALFVLKPGPLGTKGVGQPFAGTPGPRPYLGTTAAVHAIGAPQRAGLEVPLADGGISLGLEMGCTRCTHKIFILGSTHDDWPGPLCA